MRQASKNEDQTFPPTPHPISHLDFLMVLLNRAVGTGPLRLGYRFRCGAILGPLLGVGCGIMTLGSLLMLVISAGVTRKGTFEEIWEECFGRETVFICGFFSLCSNISALVIYISFILDSMKSVISELFGDVGWYVKDQFTLVVFLIFVLYLPLCLSHSIKMSAIISYIDVFCIAFLLFDVIYWFAYEVRENGFDPGQKVTYFSLSKTALTCLNGFVTAYLPFPLTFPSLSDVRSATIPSMKWMIGLMVLICFCIYIVFGELEYLTFFDANTGGLILDYYPKHPLKYISNVILVIMMLLKTPLAFNSTRQTIIMTGFQLSTIPFIMWFSIGIIIIIGCCFMATLPDPWATIIGAICDVSSPIILFVFPPIFFMKCCKSANIPSKILAVFLICFGVAAAVMAILLT